MSLEGRGDISPGNMLAYRELQRFGIDPESAVIFSLLPWRDDRLALESAFFGKHQQTLSYLELVNLAKGVALRQKARDKFKWDAPTQSDLVSATLDPLPSAYDFEELIRATYKREAIKKRYSSFFQRYADVLEVIRRENPLLVLYYIAPQIQKFTAPLVDQVFSSSIAVFPLNILSSSVDEMLIPLLDKREAVA